MKQFIGTKTINAKPMTRAKYNEYRGWQMPADEDGAEDGYLVEYVDGGSDRGNTPDYDGYVSWSPKDVFDRAYEPVDSMDFGNALVLVRSGHRVTRKGWNGKGMFIFLVPGSTFKVSRPPLLGIYPEGTEINYHPHIDMRTADGQIVPWLASQTDVLAVDWMVVE